MKFKLLNIVVFLTALISITGNVNANTICSFGCLPDPSTPPVETSSSFTEILSLGNSIVDIQNEGLIFLDSFLFDNLASLSIDEATGIYFGLSAYPSAVPENMEILTTLGLSDGLIQGSIGAEYLILREFDNTDSLILAATQGVVVLDTATLFASAVPIPASIWLFGSGLVVLLGATKKKSV